VLGMKRYLRNSGNENTLWESFAPIIEKLGQSAVECDPQELASLRTEIGAIHEALTPDLPDENALVLAKSAVQALEVYNKRITRTVSKQTSEFQAIVKMLQLGLLAIAGEKSDSFQALTKIGEEMDCGTGFKDLQSLRLRLSQCLSGLRTEIEREKSASNAVIEKLQIEIERVHASGGESRHRSVDLPTGLRCQEDCIAAIEGAIDKGTRHYAAVMVVNRVQPVNARFGRDAGDWMLSRFKHHVETRLLTSGDRLFRWTGPAMVAILERPQPIDHVRALVKRALETLIDETYEVAGRSILIPISAAWSVFMITPAPDASEKQIQAFIAGQHCRDFA
jgi:GGDEF domain-containing protein